MLGVLTLLSFMGCQGQITQPNSSSLWVWNTTATVTWNNDDAINIVLEFFDQASLTWSDSAPGDTHPYLATTIDPGTKSIAWTVPHSLTPLWDDSFRIALRTLNNNIVFSESFSVIGATFMYNASQGIDTKLNVASNAPEPWSVRIVEGTNITSYPNYVGSTNPPWKIYDVALQSESRFEVYDTVRGTPYSQSGIYYPPPTTSPSTSPTTSPSTSPTTSPSTSPTTSPSTSPTTSPSTSPTTPVITFEECLETYCIINPSSPAIPVCYPQPPYTRYPSMCYAHCLAPNYTSDLVPCSETSLSSTTSHPAITSSTYIELPTSPDPSTLSLTNPETTHATCACLTNDLQCNEASAALSLTVCGSNIVRLYPNGTTCYCNTTCLPDNSCCVDFATLCKPTTTTSIPNNSANDDDESSDTWFPLWLTLCIIALVGIIALTIWVVATYMKDKTGRVQPSPPPTPELPPFCTNDNSNYDEANIMCRNYGVFNNPVYSMQESNMYQNVDGDDSDEDV